MGIYSSGTNDGITSADPYVFPILGKPYKLPDKKRNYCLYANKNTFITAGVSKLSQKKQNEMRNWVISKLGSDTNNGAKLVTDGFFYNTLHINTSECEMFLNLESKKYKVSKKGFFDINVSNAVDNSILFKGEKKRVVNISWKINKDIISLDVDFFENPQIRNGLRIKTAIVESKSVGLLINDYSPEFLEVENKINSLSKFDELLNSLTSATTVKIENQYLQKTNERWTRHKM